MSAPAFALFGKLPAHGDFVRRGDGALVARLDGWLTGEIERLATEDAERLDARLAALPTWCFNLADGTSGALAASTDRVGRIFPIVAGVALDGAALHVATALAGAHHAETLAAALAAVCPEDRADGPEASWWQADGTITLDQAPEGFPRGCDFDRLLIGDG